MPASVNNKLFASTGNNANWNELACERTATNAAAPPGGCKHRRKNIAAIAQATATAPATARSGMNRTHRTPISAEIKLPPTTDQGCASGLAGTQNTSTALAPSGATNQGTLPAPAAHRHNAAVTNNPNSAPTMERQRSGALTAS